MGAVTPVGLDIATTWDSLINGRSGLGRITRFDPSPYETQIAGELKGFEATAYMDRKEVRRTDRFTHYAVAAARQAMTDANLERPPTRNASAQRSRAASVGSRHSSTRCCSWSSAAHRGSPRS